MREGDAEVSDASVHLDTQKQQSRLTRVDCSSPYPFVRFLPIPLRNCECVREAWQVWIQGGNFGMGSSTIHRDLDPSFVSLSSIISPLPANSVAGGTCSL